MLRSFEIVGFRTFRHLRVPKLGRVNLIVGRNNVGKTMFLEALRLYTLGGNVRAIRNLLLERDEVFTEGEKSDDTRDIQVRVSALFHRVAHSFTSPNGQDQIVLGEIEDPTRTVRVIPRLLRRVRLENTINSYGYEAVDPSEAASSPSLDTGLEVVQGKRSRLVPIGGMRGRGPEYRADDRREPPFVPARGVDSFELARWWDVIALRNSEARVLDSLRLIAPVDRVTFVEHPYSRGERIPVVRLGTEQTPVPLKSLGDGMARLFQIALAIERARAGRSNWIDSGPTLFPEWVEDGTRQTPLLLIDELEIGIHYTVHAKLWAAVIRLAELHDIQVFATTHSWDCICGLRDAVAAVPSADAVLVRLEKADGVNKAVVFDQTELDVITRDEIEVR